MARHKLSLEAPSTTDLCILRIYDTSVYNPDAPVTCPVLAVLVPGFNASVEFGEADFSLGFMLNLTACDLEIQTNDCGTTFASLPDGIYVLKYSVSPNEEVFVEYNHLRITQALIKYEEIMCELDLGACEPGVELAKKLDRLTRILRYLDGAKASVEVCHNPKKGMELYSWAVKQLDKFSCRSCHN